MNIFEILNNFAGGIGWTAIVVIAILGAALIYEKFFPWW